MFEFFHSHGKIYAMYNGERNSDPVTNYQLLLDKHGLVFRVGQTKERMLAEFTAMNQMALSSPVFDDDEFRLITLDPKEISLDNIATIFNVALNCTGHPLMRLIANNEDIETIRKHVTVFREPDDAYYTYRSSNEE